MSKRSSPTFLLLDLRTRRARAGSAAARRAARGTRRSRRPPRRQSARASRRAAAARPAPESGARSRRRARSLDDRGGGRDRSATGIGEVDRVLGGGLVPGSLVLIGGDPGIGKSTLAAADRASRSRASGAARAAGRGRRERAADPHACRAARRRFPKARRCCARPISTPTLAAAEATRPAVARRRTRSRPCRATASRAGRARCRRCASAGSALLHFAKGDRRAGVPRSGTSPRTARVAGPARARAHGRCGALPRGRALPALPRAARGKNRFGSTHELGVFEMTGGRVCAEIDNPSAAFLSESARRRAGLGRGREPRGLATAARRGAGAGVDVVLRDAAAGARTASIRARLAVLLAVLERARRLEARAVTTCS